ncbi:hypothetical protein AX15_002032 [Amanita polypyramis BW_CC]|nr:hypothetical protein AX15_002032 [Amanita polypyramis BW_CC]
MGKYLDISGQVGLKMDDKNKLKEYDCQVRLLSDIHVESALPTNAADMLTTVVKGVDLIQDGVPCDVYSTSLKRFRSQFDAASLMQELDDTQLDQILGIFNKFITLELNRVHLRLQLDQKYSTYFPSLTACCRGNAKKVSNYLREARSVLRTYLQDYRSASPGGTLNADFLDGVRRKYNEEVLDYEAERDIFHDRMQRMKAAENYQFEMIDVSTLKKLMNRTDNATIALIIIPETVLTVNLLNIYRVLVDDIRE